MYRLSSIPHRLKNVPDFLLNKLRWYNSRDVLIHIGKCGGSTVARELKNHGYKFFEVHMRPTRYNGSKNYFITIRNPISRFISAFNYMHKLVVNEAKKDFRYESEKELLMRFDSPSVIAQSLYDDSMNLTLDLNSMENYIGHVFEDINFYLEDFLNSCDPSDIGGVICTEMLSADLERVFGFSTELHERRNSGMSTHLSTKALNNLSLFLQKDFDCIEKLNKMSVLTEEQYAVLSDKSESRFCR